MIFNMTLFGWLMRTTTKKKKEEDYYDDDKEEKRSRRRRRRETGGGGFSWCFEPSQPQRIISVLETNVSSSLDLLIPHKSHETAKEKK